MREILFRAKRIDNGEWIYGYYYKHDTVKVCFTSDDPHTKHYIVYDGFCDWGFEPPSEMVEVDPNTVGQYTGMCEFVNQDPSKRKQLFEGDIIEVHSRRRIPTESYYTEKSKHDGKCIARATIVFKRGKWQLDYDNEYNHKLEAACGNEEYDRTVKNAYDLYSFGVSKYKDNGKRFMELNPTTHVNDIVCIGNIHDNPELLEDNK